ncbi:MAG: OB-fold domain-containing protein, partial [Burkholderiales bacterium]
PDYNVVLVDLDEGVRMMSRVEGLKPEDVRIGMRVQARVRTEGETPLVVFEPVAA